MKVVDMHCDTIGAIFEKRSKGIVCNLRKNDLHLDINKMEQGNYLMQNFAMFIDFRRYKNTYKTLLEMIECYDKEISDNGDKIAKVLKYEDIVVNEANGKISSLLTLEEGGAIEGSLENLQHIYKRGIRMITLNWNYPNGIGYPNVKINVDKKGEIIGKPDFTKPDKNNGLTSWGFELLEAMEYLGIIPDVSHLSDAGFYDVLKHSKKPFVASHSNARSICNNVRNMDDEMINQLAHKGGVMGINFCADFISSEKNGYTFGTISDTIEHIKYIRNIAGIDCIGLGSDYDGIPGNIEMKDCSYMPMLADELLKHKFTYDEVEKIFSKNVLRLYKELL